VPYLHVAAPIDDRRSAGHRHERPFEGSELSRPLTSDEDLTIGDRQTGGPELSQKLVIPRADSRFAPQDGFVGGLSTTSSAIRAMSESEALARSDVRSLLEALSTPV
jgi:hypothetical protein